MNGMILCQLFGFSSVICNAEVFLDGIRKDVSPVDGDKMLREMAPHIYSDDATHLFKELLSKIETIGDVLQPNDEEKKTIHEIKSLLKYQLIKYRSGIADDSIKSHQLQKWPNYESFREHIMLDWHIGNQNIMLLPSKEIAILFRKLTATEDNSKMYISTSDDLTPEDIESLWDLYSYDDIYGYNKALVSEAHLETHDFLGIDELLFKSKEDSEAEDHAPLPHNILGEFQQLMDFNRTETLNYVNEGVYMVDINEMLNREEYGENWKIIKEKTYNEIMEFIKEKTYNDEISNIVDWWIYIVLHSNVSDDINEKMNVVIRILRNVSYKFKSSEDFSKFCNTLDKLSRLIQKAEYSHLKGVIVMYIIGNNIDNDFMIPSVAINLVRFINALVSIQELELSPESEIMIIRGGGFMEEVLSFFMEKLSDLLIERTFKATTSSIEELRE